MKDNTPMGVTGLISQSPVMLTLLTICTRYVIVFLYHHLLIVLWFAADW